MKNIFKIASLISAFILFVLLCIVTAHAEPANTYLYVSNANSNSISVIDPSFNKITDISTDNSPGMLYINPSGTYLYTITIDGYLKVYSTIDYSLITKLIVTQNTAGLSPTFAINDDGTILYISLDNDCNITMVDLVSYNIIKTIHLSTGIYSNGIRPYDVIFYDGYLYVSEWNNDSVKKLDARDLSVKYTWGGWL